MTQKYKIRTLKSISEAPAIKNLFTEIFHPEKVGELAEAMLNHLPGTKPEYWFTAEEVSTGKLCAGLTLIPWHLKLEGIDLKTAEMGIVGTLEEHRNKGLIRKLSEKFDETCHDEEYDIQIIQGVPGFYHNLGYHYALPLDNHINLPLHAVSNSEKKYSIRQSGREEIPYLAEQDELFNKRFMISSTRSREHWEYIFSHGLETEYASEIYILENTDSGSTTEKYYFRINLMGFGTGLIVSEVSEEISEEALSSMLAFLKDLAIKQDKPYLRFNVPVSSPAALKAFSLGAVKTGIYGWQIKITDRIKFLNKIRPLLEKRIRLSRFKNFTGNFCLDMYRHKINLLWENGKLKDISTIESDAALTLSITEDLFVPLCLGYRSVDEIRYLRHDLYYENQTAGELAKIIFPKGESWLNCIF